MTSGAVITADIVNSTRLSKSVTKKLDKNLMVVLEPHRHEFYRGDSFQVYMKDATAALHLVLQLRTAAMKIETAGSMPLTDVRCSLGIGSVKTPVRDLKTATDEAFVLSGRAFDKMEPGERFVMSGPEKNRSINLGLEVIADFLDYLFHRLTYKQSVVIYEMLLQRNQIEIARRLKKSQATVHKHLQSAGWPEIEKLLKQYQLLVQTIE